MTFTLEIAPEADAEHADTIAWYRERASLDTAVRYATTIERALDELLTLPLAWPQWRSSLDVRVRHLPEISFSIIYRVRGQVVNVVAFAHMSRLPGYWLDRLE